MGFLRFLSFLFVVVCFVVLMITMPTARAHSSEEMKKDLKQCAEENTVKADDMKKFFETKEGSENLKCFLKCVLVHNDVLREDGTFNAEAAKEHDEEILPSFTECSNIEKTDDLCELAHRHFVCMDEKNPSRKFQKFFMESME